MPCVDLTPALVAGLSCPPGRKKLDVFDASLRGFLMEVRASGGKTYYLRYANARGRTRVLKLARAEDVSLAQARLLAERARNRIAMGEDPCALRQEVRRVLTFERFALDHYLPCVQGYKRSWRTDLCLLRKHLIPRLGALHLDEVTREHVLTVHRQRLAQGARPASANRLLILLRYMFNLALKWEMVGVHKNPAAGIPCFEENNKIERYLSASQVQALLEAVTQGHNPLLRPIVSLLVLTGARRGEVLQARWDQFDLHRRIWRIPMSKSGRARYVPLSDGALALLASLPQAAGADWLFPNPRTGKPFVSVFYSWDTARRKLGLEGLRIHDLRHSFASMLVNNGRSLYEVQHILGHRNASTTQRYAHLANDTLVDAANAATRALGSAVTAPGL